MCERIASSQEHAPPKCIFPEQKDAGGIDYRKNLIKVPSCDSHNTAKSTEDEYLMYILPTSIATNNAGINQFLTKVQRAIARKPALSSGIIAEAKKVIVHDIEKDIWFEALAIPIEMERVHKVLEMNARAIYFHTHQNKFLAPIKIYTNFSLKLDSPDMNETQEKLFTMSEEMLAVTPKQGENPDVFTYRIDREQNLELIEFSFYGSSKALAVLQHG